MREVGSWPGGATPPSGRETSNQQAAPTHHSSRRDSISGLMVGGGARVAPPPRPARHGGLPACGPRSRCARPAVLACPPRRADFRKPANQELPFGMSRRYNKG
jgi:hypothetical protein